MKNYRKLAPGEVIREGDCCAAGAVTPTMRLCGSKVLPRGLFYREVRPDPDYPGWRFGDAGELALHLVDLYGVYQDMRGTTPLTVDSETRLMEWPEDPRLVE